MENEPAWDGPVLVSSLLVRPQFDLRSFATVAGPAAKKMEGKTGVNGLVALSQASHESNNGNSVLARKYGNLFGFKASLGWEVRGKPVVVMRTWEVVKTADPEKYAKFNPQTLRTDKTSLGTTIYELRINVDQDFRVYESWDDSFLDYADLMIGRSRYAETLDLMKKGRLLEAIEALGRSGYATDPEYARKLLARYEAVLKIKEA